MKSIAIKITITKLVLFFMSPPILISYSLIIYESLWKNTVFKIKSYNFL